MTNILFNLFVFNIQQNISIILRILIKIFILILIKMLITLTIIWLNFLNFIDLIQTLWKHQNMKTWNFLIACLCLIVQADPISISQKAWKIIQFEFSKLIEFFSTQRSSSSVNNYFSQLFHITPLSLSQIISNHLSSPYCHYAFIVSEKSCYAVRERRSAFRKHEKTWKDMKRHEKTLLLEKNK
jgi:hypothetical protein